MNPAETCDTCKWLVKVYCHPLNKQIGRGSISTLLGYGCQLSETSARERNDIFFMEYTTGCYECYERKTNAQPR